MLALYFSNFASKASLRTLVPCPPIPGLGSLNTRLLELELRAPTFLKPTAERLLDDPTERSIRPIFSADVDLDPSAAPTFSADLKFESMPRLFES